MSKKIVRNESIKVRVTTEEKEILKKIATEKGITVSEILYYYVKKEIEMKSDKEEHGEKIEKRTIETESKINKLKKKMGWL